jgi:hypothetical protein
MPILRDYFVRGAAATMNASTGDPAKVNKDGQVSGEALDWLLSLQKNCPGLFRAEKDSARL